MNREPPPPGMVAAAEQDYHTSRDRLSVLTDTVRALLAGGFTDFQAVADVWLTLRTRTEPPAALLLAAVAVVQLAKLQGQSGGQAPPELGNPQ